MLLFCIHGLWSIVRCIPFCSYLYYQSYWISNQKNKLEDWTFHIFTLFIIYKVGRYIISTVRVLLKTIFQNIYMKYRIVASDVGGWRLCDDIGRRLVFGEAVAVLPAEHLVADARDVGGVGAATPAHVPHAQLQPLLDEHLHCFAFIPVYPSVDEKNR